MGCGSSNLAQPSLARVSDNDSSAGLSVDGDQNSTAESSEQNGPAEQQNDQERWFFADSEGVVCGPCSRESMVNMWRSKDISATSMCLEEKTMSEWVPAGHLSKHIATWFFVDVNGARNGPCHLQQLVQVWNQGHLAHDCLCYQEFSEQIEWKPVSEHPELMSAFVQADNKETDVSQDNGAGNILSNDQKVAQETVVEEDNLDHTDAHFFDEEGFDELALISEKALDGKQNTYQFFAFPPILPAHTSSTANTDLTETLETLSQLISPQKDVLQQDLRVPHETPTMHHAPHHHPPQTTDCQITTNPNQFTFQPPHSFLPPILSPELPNPYMCMHGYISLKCMHCAAVPFPYWRPHSAAQIIPRPPLQPRQRPSRSRQKRYVDEENLVFGGFRSDLVDQVYGVDDKEQNRQKQKKKKRKKRRTKEQELRGKNLEKSAIIFDAYNAPMSKEMKEAQDRLARSRISTTVMTSPALSRSAVISKAKEATPGKQKEEPREKRRKGCTNSSRDSTAFHLHPDLGSRHVLQSSHSATTAW
mmetsp:Transcript_22677/g.44895  ORF Transcript_22677/g.44895 Transcript_22677/m.44895 type:complete len:532 (+) Transcript_22677:53-1648(+)|eukprot:CAMPEP_0175130880 /NCGR_PEP_ID=MMETSP0087-20121206/6238_1 /TAXON_ID=136419 /ORGANISM="Unknown Unknown, Strain D1" /LENGTH=531 /DNA_ID=CAMNT_0016413119 /DNA_START=45 /DNA_END=1637 /DNA_ORIENTATION=-